MPLRDDFEKAQNLITLNLCTDTNCNLLLFLSLSLSPTLQEYDNDSETLVSGLTVNPDDEDVEKSLKLAHIDMYNKRLKEREKRKT